MKKLIFLLALFATVIGNAQIVTAWTTTLTAAQLPSGASIPTVAALAGSPKNRQDFSITVPGSLDNATKSTAFTAVGAATKDTIDASWLVPVYGIDTSLDIHGRVVITSIIRGFSQFEYGDKINQFGVGTDVFRVTGYFEWATDPN